MTDKKLLSDPPERQILGPDSIDNLGLAVLTLMRELWVVVDRQAVTERLLEQHGISSAQIDAFEPDAEFSARLDTRRQALIDSVLGAMRGQAD